jgi:hypothetical protein
VFPSWKCHRQTDRKSVKSLSYVNVILDHLSYFSLLPHVNYPTTAYSYERPVGTFQLHEFPISSSWIHDFNSQIQLHEFTMKLWIQEDELMKLKSWIHEVKILNSWSWNGEFVKWKSWIHEVEFVNSLSWNHEFVKLKSEFVNSVCWKREVKIVISWRWKWYLMKLKWPNRSFVDTALVHISQTG